MVEKIETSVTHGKCQLNTSTRRALLLVNCQACQDWVLVLNVCVQLQELTTVPRLDGYSST